MAAVSSLRRSRLMQGAALSALALSASLSGAARAQALLGTPTVQGGVANVTTGTDAVTGAPTTTVTVGSASAVIDWTPNNSGTGLITFQDVGSVATFTNDPLATSDFAVLNRVIPTDTSRPILFNGKIVSQLQQVSGATAPGGTVFFYSPGGIVVGAQAVFDVGNLTLTTSDLSSNASGAFDTSGSYQFLTSQPGATIRIDSGAQINASVGSASNAYVALVAPNIVQNGAISVDGSAALVAADAATIQFSPDGLFTIQVTSGSSGTGTVLSNGGSITGPAGAGSTLVHGIYMVAVPKNAAITMAIAGGSQLGFDVANAADVVGNTVVLSAGHDVVAGAIDPGASTGGGSGQADLRIGAITATSAVRGSATGQALLRITGGAAATFASDLSLGGVTNPLNTDANAAHVVIQGAGSSLQVGGDFLVTSLDAGAVTGGLVSDSGSAQVDVSAGGALSVTGAMTVDASRAGLGDGGSASAGDARLVAGTGTAVDVGGTLTLYATAGGAPVQASSATAAGSGTGGTASLSFGGGASVVVHGDLVVDASGSGGAALSTGFAGGSGTAGTAQVVGQAGGGTLHVYGNAGLRADGVGQDGQGCITCTVDGGNAQGGTARLALSGATAFGVTIDGTLTATADALGGAGNGGQGGVASGGSVTVGAAGAAHVLTAGALLLRAYARGGSANSAVGGAGVGGATLLQVAGGGQINAGTVDLFSYANGGDFTGTGAGGMATGGSAGLSVGTGGGALTLGDTTVNATAQGGIAADSFAGPGGAAFGGTVSVRAASGAISLHSAVLEAYAEGGLGIDRGGDGYGGSASIVSTGGTLGVALDTTLSVYARGGDGSSGGDATGGIGTIFANGFDMTFGAGTLLTIDAGGIGGGASGGGNAAGAGTGGSARLLASNGNLSLAGTVDLNAEGTGGVADSSAAGGNGTGGAVLIDARSSTAGASRIDLGQATALAGGHGSAGAAAVSNTPDNGGNGGLGTGGTIRINGSATNGTVSVVSLAAGAVGSGGAGGAAAIDDSGNGTIGGTGGDGIGGAITFSSTGIVVGRPATGGTDIGDMTVAAVGIGGLGGAAATGRVALPGSSGASGNGTGGTIAILADQGGSRFAVSGTANLGAYGVGADGTGCTACVRDAGAGQGGVILIGSNGATTTGNTIAFNQLNAVAYGLGGDAVTHDGGNGTGGSILITGGGVGVTANSATLNAPGYSGFAAGTGSGGAATGGLVKIELGTASTYDGGTLSADAGAHGGSNSQPGGSGGTAVGGAAILSSLGAAIHLTGDVSLSATANAGEGNLSSGGGSGGNGTGGTVSLISGTATQLGNGGAIRIDGSTAMNADAFGGRGTVAGTGEGGKAYVSARDGNIAGQNITMSANGVGGDAGFTGNGGAGQGGIAQIVAQSALEGAGVVSLGGVTITSNGLGGTGASPSFSLSAAGAGGTGTGGTVTVLAAAGNGTLVLGDTAVAARGLGGAGGGGGGALSVGSGGDGGTGGLGMGGFVQLGSESGLDTGALNTGSARFGATSVFADGRGGDGGAGGTGPVGGNGGAGGDALGGGAVLLVRGSHVQFSGAAQFVADAQGGIGGAGTVAGAGGNASVGVSGARSTGAALVVTNRAGHPAQRGLLDATGLSFTARAIGGVGTTFGTQTESGHALAFALTNADIAATSLEFIGSGVASLGTVAATMQLLRGTVTLSGDFSLDTPGDLSVSLGNAALTADHVAMTAENWVDPGAGALPAGTISGATSVTVQTGQDLFAYSGFASGGSLNLFADGAIGVQDLTASGAVTADAGTTLSLGNVTAGGQAFLGAPGDVTVGNIQAGSTALVSSGGLLAIGAVRAGEVARLFGAAGVNAGNVTAGDAVAVGSGGAITAGLLSAGLVTPSSDPLATYDVTVQADGAIRIGGAQALGAVKLFGAQTIDIGAVAGSDVAVLSGGNQTIAGIAASGRVLLADVSLSSAGGTVSSEYDLDAVFAAAPVATAGTITLDGAVSATQFTAATQADFSALDIQSSGALAVSVGNTVTAGNLAAGSGLDVHGGLSVALGTVKASGGDVAIVSGRSVTTGAVTATSGNVALAGATGLIADVIRASGDVALQAGEGSLSAAGVQAGGTLSASGVDFVTIGRSVAGQAINVQTNGLVTVAGQWQAPSITILSGDIAIPGQPSGASFPVGLNAGTTGTIRLVSRGTAPMLIGDGVTGSGYALDNAEWSRINSGSLRIEGAAMRIGTLDVTGPDAGSTIDDPTGTVTFSTGGDGTIRLAGALTATGFRAGNALVFDTGRFELDADTASLAILGSGTAPSGTLRIVADHIHVASGSVLDKLAQDPFYAGLADDLATPAVGARGAVVRAGAFDMRVGSTFYVQNTGTRAVPAGFLVPLDGFAVRPIGTQPVTMIVNGGFLSTNGTLTGRFAFDSFKARSTGLSATGLSAFASTSSLNGCLLTATSCGPQPDPDPGISNQIDVLLTPGLGDTPALPPVEEEDGPAAAAGKDGTAGPIAPPAPLFNARPLDPQGDIDEPVAGSGNPGLMGLAGPSQGEPK